MQAGKQVGKQKINNNGFKIVQAEQQDIQKLSASAIDFKRLVTDKYPSFV